MSSSNRPILLVEDNPMDVDLTKRAFVRSNIANPVEVARDGEEALAFISKWESGESLPIVILLDLKLPKVNGLEVLQRLKQHEHFSTIPVVILTTSNEERDVQTAYQRGANSYIIKPVDFDDFVQMVNQIQLYWCSLNIPPNN